MSGGGVTFHFDEEARGRPAASTTAILKTKDRHLAILMQHRLEKGTRVLCHASGCIAIMLDDGVSSVHYRC